MAIGGVATNPHQNPTGDAVRFWEEHHRRRRPATVDRVNPVLAEVAASLTPGAALDLGCGAGGDTLWLARRG